MSSSGGAKPTMKLRLFNLLTVFLAASGLLTLSQAALGQSKSRQNNVAEEEHLVCVKQAQQLLCHPDISGEREVVPQLLSPQQQKLIENILLWLSYLLPGGLILGIFLSDNYHAYRSTVLKRQIELLERCISLKVNR